VRLLVILLALSFSLHAALPPEVQDAKDRVVIERFLQKHPQIQKVVTRIDYDKFIIYFSKECKAYFRREIQFRLPGWVGPAAPLIYSHSNCDLYSLRLKDKWF
jgi:hypothetical protein